ncbi:MAG: gamma-glutamyl-gamma-aminobutyrate hydrolase family protein [Nitrospinota bacterium]|nr:gamma-glutamyl-gamma-aminobutyrate hydrolase family protein [Nitrospinota bacterium]
MGVNIGITSDTGTSPKPVHRKHEYFWIKKDLAESVFKAGGIPFIIPACGTKIEAEQIMNSLDGLVISGGNFDIDPALYGAKRKKVSNIRKKERTISEILLLSEAIRQNKPVLGICGGEQLINVHFGGTLYQDIPSEIPGALDHVQKTHFSKTCHAVSIERGTLLAEIMGVTSAKVNSTHHQSIKDVAAGLTVSAMSPDGVIEAIEKPGDLFLLGVQWHPEFLSGDDRQIALFKTLVGEAKKK